MHFFKTTDKLLEIEVTLQEKMLTIILLSSLPKAFENFVSAMKTRENLRELADLQVTFLEEGARQKEGENNNNFATCG